MTRWEKAFWGAIAVALIVFQGGCALYHACKDGLCR
jgi:hypothetical protein